MLELVKYFTVVFICSSVPIRVSGLCSTDFTDNPTYPYRLYQGSTLYETVRGDIASSGRPPRCLPKSIVFIARHGSRHPGTEASSRYRALDNLQSIINSTGSATICKQDLIKIAQWRNWYRASLDKDLAVTGVAEMRGLSKRFASAFPELFSNASAQRFISSDYQRTVESAQEFKNATFGLVSPFTIELNNLLMRSWEYCQHYGKRASKNRKKSRIGDLVRRFQASKVRRLGKKLAKRLGVPQSRVNLTLAEIIYLEGCAREAWATGEDSPWCLVLRKRDQQVFEYERDMRDYLKHIASANYRQSCQLKQFILSTLRNASIQASRNEPTTNIFLFTHKPTVLHLLREMTLIEDEGLFRGRDFKSKLNRKFRVSKLAPGSGNIAFVLHQCADDQMKLQVFHNERLLQLPLREPNRDGLWNLEDALAHFGFYGPSDCNIENICPFAG